MKLQSLESLVDALDGDIAWRRKEMTSMLGMLQSAEEDPLKEGTLIRASTDLLYAHWEGFIKYAAESYLNFVSFQRLKNSELSLPFLSLILRHRFHQANAENGIASFVAMLKFTETQMSDRSRVPFKKIIQTQSNLSSMVLFGILSTIDISNASYAIKAKLIDNRLLARRNHIANVQATPLNREEYDLLHGEILALMSMFRNDVENAAVLRRYARAS